MEKGDDLKVVLTCECFDCFYNLNDEKRGICTNEGVIINFCGSCKTYRSCPEGVET